MGDRTNISWTDHTFNGWIGCNKVSAGCDHCYAEVLATGRMGRDGTWGPPRSTRRDRTSPAYWKKPYRWDAGDRVFCGSMMDWAEWHPDINDVRTELWDLIRECDHLTWQMLTKRVVSPRGMQRVLPPDWGDGWPHVQLGVSVENMDVAYRIDRLRAIPAHTRFVSYEPALGPLHTADVTDIDWMIYGGESGSGFRLDDDQWARDMRDVCRREGIAFFYKQASGSKPGTRPTLDGRTYHEFPPAVN